MRQDKIYALYFSESFFGATLHFTAWRSGGNRSTKLQLCKKKVQLKTELELALKPTFCQTAVMPSDFLSIQTLSFVYYLQVSFRL